MCLVPFIRLSERFDVAVAGLPTQLPHRPGNIEIKRHMIREVVQGSQRRKAEPVQEPKSHDHGPGRSSNHAGRCSSMPDQFGEVVPQGSKSLSTYVVCPGLALLGEKKNKVQQIMGVDELKELVAVA